MKEQLALLRGNGQNNAEQNGGQSQGNGAARRPGVQNAQ